MAKLRETGGFDINGEWAMRVAYEADLHSGLVSRVELRFVIGRSLVAQAQLTRADALEILGYKNLVAIEQAASDHKEGIQERIKGELRGRTLHYGQANLARLDELDLDDLSLNFDHVVVPKEQPLSDHELDTAVDRFLKRTSRRDMGG